MPQNKLVIYLLNIIGKQQTNIYPKLHPAGVKRSASPANETREARGRRQDAGSTTPAASAVAASPAPGSNAGAGAGTGGNAGANAVACGNAGSPAASPRPAHAACPLLVNVLLADTVLNVFRDHNFDSCTLCVCNAGPKVGYILVIIDQ